MISPKVIILIFAVFFTALAGGVILATKEQKTAPSEPVYNVSDTDRPKAETGQISADLGNMKVDEVKGQDFELKNTGTKPLQILSISSSCNCTFGQLIYKDFKSREYGMHNQSGYVTEIAPGETAKVRVTYKPYIMPVYGLVEREVYVVTNDPDKSRLVFRVRATVK